MKIHFPYIYPGKINDNDTYYHINYRILFWHFQLVEELAKRGWWIIFRFNTYQFKKFLEFLKYKNTKWSAFTKNIH